MAVMAWCWSQKHTNEDVAATGSALLAAAVDGSGAIGDPMSCSATSETYHLLTSFTSIARSGSELVRKYCLAKRTLFCCCLASRKVPFCLMHRCHGGLASCSASAPLLLVLSLHDRVEWVSSSSSSSSLCSPRSSCCDSPAADPSRTAHWFLRYPIVAKVTLQGQSEWCSSPVVSDLGSCRRYHPWT